MLLNLLTEGRFPHIFAGIALLGVMAAIVQSGIYKRYLRQLRRTGRDEKTWPGQMRAGLEFYYRTRNKAPNVELYVKNMMESRSIAGIRLRTWERIVKQWPVLLVILGAAAGLYAYAEHFPVGTSLVQAAYAVLAALGCCLGLQLFHVGAARYQFQIAVTEQFINVWCPKFAVRYASDAAQAEMPLTEPDIPEPQKEAAGGAGSAEETDKHIHVLQHDKQLEREEKKEKELREHRARIAEKKRREEERAKARQEAIQAAYEEKQRKLREKYMGKIKEECAVSEDKKKEDGSELIEDVLKEFLL